MDVDKLSNPSACVRCELAGYSLDHFGRDGAIIGVVYDNFEYSILPEYTVSPEFPKQLRIRQSSITKRARRIAKRRLSTIREDPIEHRDLPQESERCDTHPSTGTEQDGEHQLAQLRPSI